MYSATGDGKIPWVSADDIAAVAVRALTDEVAPNTEYLVLGPELLSYGDVRSVPTVMLKYLMAKIYPRSPTSSPKCWAERLCMPISRTKGSSSATSPLACPRTIQS